MSNCSCRLLGTLPGSGPSAYTETTCSNTPFQIVLGEVIRRQWVPLRTMGAVTHPLVMDGAPSNVLAGGDGLQVFWVDAAPHSTDVINLQPGWDVYSGGSDVGDSMCLCPWSAFVQQDAAISGIVGEGPEKALAIGGYSRRPTGRVSDLFAEFGVEGQVAHV